MLIRFLNAGIWLDVVGILTNQNLAWRCAEGCTEVCRGVCGGAWRCAEGCMEVCKGVQRGTQRCAEVFQRGGGEKNSGFQLIRFLNADIWLDVVGTINQSESCVEVCGGAWRCAEGCVEVCRGARRYAEGCTEVHGGARRCVEGCHSN